MASICSSLKHGSQSGIPGLDQMVIFTFSEKVSRCFRRLLHHFTFSPARCDHHQCSSTFSPILAIFHLVAHIIEWPQSGISLRFCSNAGQPSQGCVSRQCFLVGRCHSRVLLIPSLGCFFIITIRVLCVFQEPDASQAFPVVILFLPPCLWNTKLFILANSHMSVFFFCLSGITSKNPLPESWGFCSGSLFYKLFLSFYI